MATTKITKPSATRATGQRKTETLSLRLDVRTKYGLELLSRLQRRPVAGVAEWCIWETFAREKVPNHAGQEVPIERLLNELALSSELEQVLVLGFIYPSLLSFEESRMYRVLLETKQLWTDRNHHHTFGSFRFNEVAPNWEKLRSFLLASAQGKRPLVALSDAELKQAGLGALESPF